MANSSGGTNRNSAVVVIGKGQDLKQVLDSKSRAIVGCYAGWSRGSEEVITTVTSQLTQAHKDDVAVATLDVGQYEDLAFEQGVSFMPYFIFYRNGRRVKGQTLSNAEQALESCRHFATSMDEDDGEEEEAAAPPPFPSSKLKANGGIGDKKKPFYLVDRIIPGQSLRLFIAGDRSKVGKSSVCLGLLGSLLDLGFKPQDLAYIKPATQCESPQLVTKWSDAMGVANRGIGPVVFYKGFTREFLKGAMGTSQDLLKDIRESVEEIGKGKKVILIDGVGYPAVGSICGISNADIAQVLQCPIVVVGRAGVGDAVDSFNLNATFFRYRGLKVLGGIFNRLPTEGFYSLENCKEAVSQYFQQYQPETKPYGFLPELPELLTVREEIDAEHASKADLEAAKEARRLETAKLLIDTFTQHVDLAALVQDAYNYNSISSAGGNSGTTTQVTAVPEVRIDSSSLATMAGVGGVGGGGGGEGGGARKRKTREEIEGAAKKQGAKAGG